MPSWWDHGWGIEDVVEEVLAVVRRKESLVKSDKAGGFF
jgi:hypothetical protein